MAEDVAEKLQRMRERAAAQAQAGMPDANRLPIVASVVGASLCIMFALSLLAVTWVARRLATAAAGVAGLGGAGGSGSGGAGGSGSGGSGGSALDLIPTGPITDAERAAVEIVLATKPEPKSYKDEQNRLWTPCVSWWLGKNIPDWPPGVWPGQVPFLYQPPDVADWLGAIAGYQVYKGPLRDAASKTFPDEALTVAITERLAMRRVILRQHTAARLKELGRPNPTIKCDVVGPICTVSSKDIAPNAITPLIQAKIEIYEASRSIEPIELGVKPWVEGGDPWWRWVFDQAVRTSMVELKGGGFLPVWPCQAPEDTDEPLYAALFTLRDAARSLLGDVP